MEQDFTEIQKLVALKRYEMPSDDYFEDFLDEFHRRQRADLMNHSARSLFIERAMVWFRELGAIKYAYGAGIAYAAIMIAFFAWPRGEGSKTAEGETLSGNRQLEHVEFEKKKVVVPEGGEGSVAPDQGEF